MDVNAAGPLSPGDPAAGGDPVRRRRAQVSRLASAARRIGLGCFLAATAVLVAGLVTTFTETLAQVVVALLVGGSVILAPAMVLGYATKAAERQDRERGI